MEGPPNDGSDQAGDVPEDGVSPPSKRPRTVPSKTLNGDRTLLHSCIVKLIVSAVCPDYAEPWRRSTQESWTGTGFLISDRRIVTNAHVVERCTHVRARKSCSPVMFSCKVEWLSIPLDLALLTVNDEDAFFQSSAAETKTPSPEVLSLCTILPRLDENVTCVGFPQGGSQISVTRGVVSRVDVGSNGVLRIQIDAAINPGNSGGPVFDESGRVVGVAMSCLKGGQNVGYIIPVEVLSNFLSMCDENVEASAIERSSLNASPGATESPVNIEAPKMVPGIVAVDAYTQTLESKALRKKLGLDDDGHAGGVRVAGLWLPSPRYPSLDADDDENECVLQVDDVLMTIDGVEVGQDGTVPLSASRPDERISKSHLFTQGTKVGQKIQLGILRAGQQMIVQHKLVPLRYLCAVHDSYDAHPSYVVSGGCVFVPLSWPWISSHKHSDGWDGGFPSFNSLSSLPAQGDKQIIVLSRVLADEVNIGYHLKKYLILLSVNGKEPANMRELVRLIARAGNETHLEFRLHPINEKYNEQVIVLDMEECKEAEDRILKQHMIASWCSDDAIPAELDAAKAKSMVSTLAS